MAHQFLTGPNGNPEMGGKHSGPDHTTRQKEEHTHKSYHSAGHDFGDQYMQRYIESNSPKRFKRSVEVIEISDDEDNQLGSYKKPQYNGSWKTDEDIYPDDSAGHATECRPVPYQREPAERLSAAEEMNNLAGDVVPITEPSLCKEQADLVDLILSGKNVFYTGSAGCGKSTVLKSFVKKFRERGKQVDIIAPTGRAALDIGGSTTWTYMGWVPSHHKKPLEELLALAHGKHVWQRLNATHVLVFDEISMVENLHFERLNQFLQEARGSGLAFGGVQLVVTGDFCQLPPVKPFQHCIQCGREMIRNREGTEHKCTQHGIYYDKDKWAFRSDAWKQCNFQHVNLSTIHRQSDKVFIDILQKLRIGRPLLPKDLDLLLNHEARTTNAVKLFGSRMEVDMVNNTMFQRLRSTPRKYKCKDHFQWNPEHMNHKFKGARTDPGDPDSPLAELEQKEHRYSAHVQLKRGMLVVLLVNLDISRGLVNGAQGTIQGFKDYDPMDMPHTIKNGKPDTMTGGRILAGDYAELREAEIKKFMTETNRNCQLWPEVQFLNGERRVIHADCTVHEFGDKRPYTLIMRTQIPLTAGYAMTTHKSQGMTLNRVEVDLSRTFEPGQAYVALSRARSLDGLTVKSFPPNAQRGGDPQVQEFLKEKFGI